MIVLLGLLFALLVLLVILVGILVFAGNMRDSMIDGIVNQLREVRQASYVCSASLETVKLAMVTICESLALGVKTRDSLSCIFFVYRIELLFEDGETASKLMSFPDSIGIDDEIEILSDGDDEPGLSVTFDDDCFALHPLEGFTELAIPVEDDIDEFRDRLISDGWQITSLDEEEDDDVLPDETESVCQGK